MEALQRFAQHTRHRNQPDLTLLARKWLTLHVSAPAEVRQTYALVADDYALLEARTHSPPLASYVDPSGRVDVGAFVWLMKNGYPNDRPLTADEEMQWPELARFRDTFWPAPVGQEDWEPFERRDHWKERAYFLADRMRSRAQYHALVDAIYRDGLTTSPPEGGDVKDAVSDLFTRLVRYRAEPTVHELGTLIGALDLSHLQDGLQPVEVPAPVVQEEPEKTVVPLEEPVEQPVELVSASPSAALDEAALRAHPDVVAFRQRELLPPTFPVAKVLKQMLLAHVQLPVPPNVLSPAQRDSGQPVLLAPLETLPEVALQLLDVAPHETLASQLDLTSASLKAHYFSRSARGEDAGRPITPQALIRAALSDSNVTKIFLSL